jgi:hypothetical protein
MFDQHPSDACEATGHLFRNADWRVLDDGLEHCATGYFIARETIAMRRGEFWEWPLHLAEKSWCTPRSFRQAFLMAVQAFGAVADESLARSFAVGVGLVAGASARAAADGIEDFVALGDIVRPKPVGPVSARKRNAGNEARTVMRRFGTSLPQRAGDAIRQRAAL